MPQSLTLDVRSEMVNLLAGINDLPLVVNTGDGIKTKVPLNEWLMPGPNRLTVKLGRPLGQWFQPGRASVTASIQARPGPDAAPPARLPSFSWPMPNRAETYPFVFSSPPFQAAAPSTKLWQESEVIAELTLADRQAILALTLSLSGAMGERNLFQVMDLLKYRTAELALAYGSDLDADVAKSREFFSSVFGSEGFAMRPIDQHHVQFTIVGNRHLVWVTQGETGNIVATVRLPRFRYSLPVLVAKIRGAWLIAR
jgi:hypothetical protein